jgi:hypothetical protein
MNLKSFLTESEAAPAFAKYLKKAEKHVRSELASEFRLKPKFEVKVVSPYKAIMTLDIQHFMHPEDIDATDDDFKFALNQADTEGHIFKLEVGNATGSHFVEAMISGLKPGMTVKAEAFFPTLEYEITFKQIMKK